MRINTRELINLVSYFSTQLKTVRRKIEYYAEEELKKRGGSNFALEFGNDVDDSLAFYEKKLETLNVFSLDSYSVEQLLSTYAEAPKTINGFLDQCDKLFASENGSMNEISFYSSFSQWFLKTFSLIQSVCNDFIERNDILKIISEKDQIEELLKKTISKNTEMEETLVDFKSRADDFLVKLEQNVTEHQVSDIKKFYSDMITQTENEKKINGWAYYGLSTLLTVLLVFIFFNMGKIYEHDYLLIPKSILSCTLIGFISFVINDFRKRFNVAKNILDELNQKSIVVDTYSSLLSRIKDFDKETKEKYHSKIIQNIIDTLLMIRNHGYMSKAMNQSSPNTASKIIEEIGNIIPKNGS